MHDDWSFQCKISIVMGYGGIRVLFVAYFNKKGLCGEIEIQQKHKFNIRIAMLKRITMPMNASLLNKSNNNKPVIKDVCN